VSHSSAPIPRLRTELSQHGIPLSDRRIDRRLYHRLNHGPTSPLMPQPMTGSTERHQILRPVRSSALSRHDMMNFEKPRPPTTRRPTTVPVPRRHLPAHPRRDRRRVPTAQATDRGVAAHPFGIGTPQLSFSGIGLDGHPSCRRVLMNMDLHRWPPDEGPRGAFFPRRCCIETCASMVRGIVSWQSREGEFGRCLNRRTAARKFGAHHALTTRSSRSCPYQRSASYRCRLIFLVGVFSSSSKTSLIRETVLYAGSISLSCLRFCSIRSVSRFSSIQRSSTTSISG